MVLSIGRKLLVTVVQNSSPVSVHQSLLFLGMGHFRIVISQFTNIICCISGILRR